MDGATNKSNSVNHESAAATRDSGSIRSLLDQQPSICFVAPMTYSIFIGDRSIRVIGGAQVQQSLLARAFVKRGYKVSMIALNYGQEDGVVIDGVTFYRAHLPDEGIPGVRFFHPRLSSIWEAMRRADADIYYQRASGALTAFVVAFAKRYQRLSVYAAASDRDFFAKSPLPHWRDRKLFHWGLRHADLVVAQTKTQQVTMAQNFARDSVLVRSCYDAQGQPGSHEGVILWAANILPVKRPELFVELARLLPRYKFKMIGGLNDALVAPLRNLAQGLTNIEFTGFVPFAEVESHFDGASILVNTSSNEGFPNTFLQAWSRAIPTVSMFDPGTYQNGVRVGEVVGSIEEMSGAILAIKSDPMRWRSLGEASRRYFEENHSVTQAVDSYGQHFSQAMGSRTVRLR
jgi:glycosyltransferase involved in cell wall biosynthesis